MVCSAPENHVGVELPASVRWTGGGGVVVQGARLQVGHVGHQVEVVTTGHTAQPLENLWNNSNVIHIHTLMLHGVSWCIVLECPSKKYDRAPLCCCISPALCRGSSSPAGGQGWFLGSYGWRSGCSWNPEDRLLETPGSGHPDQGKMREDNSSRLL